MYINLDSIFESIKKLNKKEQLGLFKNKKFLELRSKNYYDFYDIFAYLIKNNQEESEKIILSDPTLIQIFVNAEAMAYYEITFSYDFVKELIVVIKKNHLEFKDLTMFVFKNITDPLWQEKLLKEDIDASIKINLLNVFDEKVVSKYLENESPSLTDKQVYDLIRREVNVPEAYYLNKHFFKNQIMSSNLTQMRETLIGLERFIDVSYFKELKYKMLDEILSSYHQSTFSLDKNSLASSFLNSYFLKHKESHDVTKKIIINLVIDNLFDDSLRNVCLNIEEILAYQKEVSKVEKSHIEFYQKIITIFDLSIDLILEMYRKYKKEEIQTIFYEDIRTLKNDSYQKIIEACLKVKDLSPLKNKELSDKYSTTIYELNGEPFTCLVSCLNKPQDDISEFKRNCYSLISDKNMHIFLKNSYVFGYDSILADHIMHIYEQDAYSNAMVGGSVYINRIRNKDFILNSNFTNEIQIVNDLHDEKKRTYKRVKPAYLVCFSKIEDYILKASQEMNLPILLIHKEKYKLKDENKSYSKKEIDNMYYDTSNKEIEEDSYKNNTL